MSCCQVFHWMPRWKDNIALLALTEVVSEVNLRHILRTHDKRNNRFDVWKPGRSDCSFKNTKNRRRGKLHSSAGMENSQMSRLVWKNVKKTIKTETGGWREKKLHCHHAYLLKNWHFGRMMCVRVFCITSQTVERRSYFSQHFCVQVIFNRLLLSSSFSQTRTRSVIHPPPVRSCGSHVTLANAQKEHKMRKKKGGKGEQNCSSHREL